MLFLMRYRPVTVPPMPRSRSVEAFGDEEFR
jgi:hypothetical protein